MSSSRTSSLNAAVAAALDQGFRVRLRGRNPAGCSAYSSWVVKLTGTLPATPTTFGASMSGLNAQIYWNDLDAGELEYRVERREHDGVSWSPYTFVASVGPDVTTYQDTPATGVTLQYRVRACNNVGCAAPKSGPAFNR